ncbi:MAG TPA: HAD-IA family hydrolase [Candidatus Limnocylindria bacterium]|nr:HAD-IA family hydrolase [Candidatus Limnocylindria bacterium]
MPATLRAVFLDIGDTVMRPNPSWEHVYSIAFGEFGLQVTPEQLRPALRKAYHHGGWGFEGGFEPTEETSYRRTVEIDQAAIAELGVGPMPDGFFRRLSELFTITSNWHVFPDSLRVLEGLHDRDLIVGAVSNWVWSLPELLHSLRLVGRFDFLAVSSHVGFEKPHPRIFEWALEQAGVPADTVIHVGDHLEADVRGAEAVGIDGVLIDRFDRHGSDEIPADVTVITSLDELLPIVDRRLAAGNRLAG